MQAHGRVSWSGADSLRSAGEPGFAEKAFVVFVLLLSLGAFQNLSVKGPIETQNMGMVGMQILWSVVYLITWALCSRSCGKPLRSVVLVAPLSAVVVFALASVLWSQAPALTVRRSIALLLTLVFGVYFASRFTRKQQFRLLAWAFAICIVFSFVFELLDLNPSEGSPGWYGVFDIKNTLGQNMVLAAMVFWFWKRVDPEQKVLATAGFCASVALIVLSLSATAFVVFALLMVLLPYLEWTQRRSRRRAVMGTSFLIAAGTWLLVYCFTHLYEVTAVLGRDPALTGRVPLWIASAAMALQRPFFGYGFNAFWLPDQTYLPRMWHLLTWMAPQAHNGLLELWLELGLMGVGLFLVVFAYYVTRALQCLRRNADPGAAWPIIFLAFVFLTNLTTAFFLVSNSIYFILYAAIAKSLYTAREANTKTAFRFASGSTYA
jgi:exopolysaccharide production protein ExoQ